VRWGTSRQLEGLVYFVVSDIRVTQLISTIFGLILLDFSKELRYVQLLC